MFLIVLSVASESVLDGVFGNHMGNHYNPEKAPETGDYLGAEGSLGRLSQDEEEEDLEEEEESWGRTRCRLGLSEDGADRKFGHEDPLLRPSADQLKKVRDMESQQHNAELRVLITKEIRKPGRRE